MAWGGVLCLAYQGFPPELWRLKNELNRLPALKTENPGSAWPKTSLGALRDEADFSRADLKLLKDICLDFEKPIQTDPWCLPVKILSLVLFSRRSLEEVLARQDFELPGAPDSAEPLDPSETRRIDTLLADFSPQNLTEYYPRIVDPQTSGHSRISSYRRDLLETTLVVYLPEHPVWIREFQQAVDRRLPGRYAWFETSTLHVTLRAIR